MSQPETLQSLIDRLNNYNISNTEFKDIQIKAAELLKQLFPTNSASDVYTINGLRLYGQSDYDSIAQFKSILEAKLQTILRADQARQKVAADNQLLQQKRQQVKLEEQKASESKYILELQHDLRSAKDNISQLSITNKDLNLKIESLIINANKRYKNHLVKDLSFWGVIIAICALFLYAGYYWGNNKFDSEKFLLKEQRDTYKLRLDSILKAKDILHSKNK